MQHNLKQTACITAHVTSNLVHKFRIYAGRFCWARRIFSLLLNICNKSNSFYLFWESLSFRCSCDMHEQRRARDHLFPPSLAGTISSGAIFFGSPFRILIEIVLHFGPLFEGVHVGEICIGSISLDVIPLVVQKVTLFWCWDGNELCSARLGARWCQPRFGEPLMCKAFPRD